MTVLFSIIAPVLLFIIYRIFLNNVLPDAIAGVLGDYAADIISMQTITGASSAWMMAGVAIMSCFSVSTNASLIMIRDKDLGIIDDFTASPFSQPLFLMAYFLAAFIITFVLSFVALSIGLFYLAVFSPVSISFVDFLALIGILFISCLSIVMMMMCIMSFFSSPSTTAAFNGIFSALIGFFIAAFLPHGMLPDSVRAISGVIPGTHTATLMRSVMLNSFKDSLYYYLAAMPDLHYELAEWLSFNVVAYGTTFSFSAMMLYVVGSIFVFSGLFVLINWLMGKKKR